MINYALPELMKSPINEMLQNLLSGYKETTQARYLEPTLKESLQKAQLENKWYEPNIKSQIGLRGAQAGQANAHSGLLGEQTYAEHLRNQYLPEQLTAQKEAAVLKSIQDKMFNQMLQKRLSGGPQQSNAPSMQYNPGMGQVPFNAEPVPIAPREQLQESNFNFNEAPQISDDDLINKKFFNLDTFTPKYKAYIDSVTKNMNNKQAAQIKLDADQAMEDFKVSSAAQNDVPVLEKALQSAERMKAIIQNRPAFFGHWIAPGLFAKRSSDPLSGEFQALLVPQIASMEKQLSEKGNQLALKTASQKLPSFEETQSSALGKTEAIIASLRSQIEHSKNLAGGNIVRRGNKRFKFIDGQWFEIKRGDY